MNQEAEQQEHLSTANASSSACAEITNSSSSSSSATLFFDRVILCIAKLFTKRPCIVLLLTLTIALILTWFGLSQNGFPEFDDPYLGFETRFTSIANRLATLENFRHEVNRLQILENYPGEKITEREWKRRKRREISDSKDESNGGGGAANRFHVHENSPCTISPVEGYGRIGLELQDPSETFSYEVQSLICFYQKLLEEIPAYSQLCEHDDEKQCCTVWSLPNYITLFFNKSDCIDLKGKDIHEFQLALDTCIEIYKNGTQQEDCTFRKSSCPAICHAEGILHSAYWHTLDKYYVLGNRSRFSLIILPISKAKEHSPLLQYFQDQIQLIRMPNEKISLAGFDFGGKDSVFRNYLIWDLKYVVIGSVIIFIIVCLYTHSIFVSLISFSVLLLSLGVSYFMYFSVFSIHYFPFMNMLVAIVILGVGTDGTLIYSIVWQRQRIIHPILNKNTKLAIMVSVLKETTTTLLITTCTTAGAFLASLTSSITTIRCFSIFAGTSIIISFILVYICVPTALLLGDTIWLAFSSMILSSEQIKGKFVMKFIAFYQKISKIESKFPSPSSISTRMLRLADSNKFWGLSFVISFAFLIWSLIAITYSPGIQLPSSEQFQLLSSSHPIEIFDHEIEPRFKDLSSAMGDDEQSKMTLYFIWGLQSIDNGHGLDPYDSGKLQFENSFSFSSKSSQKWMRKLCKKLQKTPFYNPSANLAFDTCFIETMVKWMKRDCNKPFLSSGINKSRNASTVFTTATSSYEPCCKLSKFPYEPPVFKKCLGHLARDVYRTPSTFFQPDIAGPKFSPVNMNSITTEVENDDLEGEDMSPTLAPIPNTSAGAGGQLATFSLRINTNVSFSLVYDKMDEFYKQVQSFFDENINSNNALATELGPGFVISSQWDYYDLQNCLIIETWQSVLLSIAICFVLLWVSSFSLSIALGAIFTIFATVIVTVAILIQFFSWKLGVFEAIAVTVAVGLSDFIAHHSVEFSKSKSVRNMASPTFFSALTTITMGLSMMCFSNVLVYQQIGSFFFILVITSWLYSVFFLTPVLIVFDKFAIIICEWITRICCTKERGRNETSSVITNMNGKLLTVGQKPISTSPKSQNTPNGHDEEETDSEHDFIISNSTSVTIPESSAKVNVPEKNQSIMMEKWKLLKKVAHETTV